MSLRTIDRFHNHSKSASFNLTAIIDIVFLLMIFFIIVCRFIEAENFPLTVSDGCKFAQTNHQSSSQVTTLSVMKTDESKITFAVCAKKVAAQASQKVIEELTDLIDIRLRSLPTDGRIVTLRIDKDVPFADAQYALAALSASTATDIKLAALKKSRDDSL